MVLRRYVSPPTDFVMEVYDAPLVLIFLALFIPLFGLTLGFQLAGRAAAPVDLLRPAGDDLGKPIEAIASEPAAAIPENNPEPAVSGSGEPWFVNSRSLPDDASLIAGGSPAWQAMQDEQAKAREAFQNAAARRLGARAQR